MTFTLKKLILCVVCGVFSIYLFAQNTVVSNYKQKEDSIRDLFKNIPKIQNDDAKMLLGQRIDSLFTMVLNQPGSFEYNFDSLSTVSKVYSPDHSFKVISWNIPFENGTFKYYGYLQILNQASEAFKLFHLNDSKDVITKPENTELSADKWLGAMYYFIVKQKSGNINYYTLLGLEYFNANISRKIIEIMYFNDSGYPVFGAPIILQDNALKYRLVFQYSSHVAMSLKFDKKLKMIIFDHLSPVEQIYTGEFEYYGPDLSFDGLEFKNDKWIYRSNIDLREPTGIK